MSIRPLDVLRFAAVVAWFGVLSLSASAYSARVQSACKGDYYAHCSQFSVGTPEVAQCMRKVGEGLSLPCLAALADDGQISKAEIDAYYARQQGKAAGAQGPKAVAAAKANPAAKTVSLTKPGKTNKVPAKTLATTKTKGPAGTYVATAKNYDAPEAGNAPPRKTYGDIKNYGDKKTFGQKYFAEPKAAARAPSKSIRSDDAVVAKNTGRAPRGDDDDGWYDDNFFGGGGYSAYASGYAARGANYGPPDPYQNPRDSDEYRR